MRVGLEARSTPHSRRKDCNDASRAEVAFARADAVEAESPGSMEPFVLEYRAWSPNGGVLTVRARFEASRKTVELDTTTPETSLRPTTLNTPAFVGEPWETLGGTVWFTLSRDDARGLPSNEPVRAARVQGAVPPLRALRSRAAVLLERMLDGASGRVPPGSAQAPPELTGGARRPPRSAAGVSRPTPAPARRDGTRCRELALGEHGARHRGRARHHVGARNRGDGADR